MDEGTQRHDGRRTWPRPTYDLVGIGFGPANLALAALLSEEGQGEERLESLFLERREGFAWHPDMLIGGTRIQLSFLKDLVTLRNPRSRFSFLAYLQEKGRLEDFVNLREFFPTRLEFNDYYRWVAAQVRGSVRYRREVVAIEPVPEESGGIGRLRVRARELGTGVEEDYFTRNLVFATGGVPYVPEGVELDHRRVFHCRDFLGTVRSSFPKRDAPYRFIVVGSGQSAAEIFQYLYTNYPKARVTAALRRYAYKPADESQFVNEIFHTSTVDFLYDLPGDLRHSVIHEHYDTNYSAVDLSLIREIYAALYERKVQGEEGVEVRSLLDLRGVSRRGETIEAQFYNRAEGRMETLETDGLILATGYCRNRHPALLDGLAPYLETDDEGGYRVERSYRIHTAPTFQPQVFLQGFCEDTHGLSDTLLSVLPVRAREIFEALTDDGEPGAARFQAPAQEPFQLAETGG